MNLFSLDCGKFRIYFAPIQTFPQVLHPSSMRAQPLRIRCISHWKESDLKLVKYQSKNSMLWWISQQCLKSTNLLASNFLSSTSLLGQPRSQETLSNPYISGTSSCIWEFQLLLAVFCNFSGDFLCSRAWSEQVHFPSPVSWSRRIPTEAKYTRPVFLFFFLCF